MSRRNVCNMWVALLVVMAMGICSIHAFVVVTPHRLARSKQHPKRMPMVRHSKNKYADPEYMRLLQEAAKDPAAFERFVMADGGDNSTVAAAVATTATTTTATATRFAYTRRQTTTMTITATANNNTNTGYQRVEDWDTKRNRDDMSWEEKVQFDGQRMGNRVRQDDILRRNLHTW